MVMIAIDVICRYIIENIFWSPFKYALTTPSTASNI